MPRVAKPKQKVDAVEILVALLNAECDLERHRIRLREMRHKIATALNIESEIVSSDGKDK